MPGINTFRETFDVYVKRLDEEAAKSIARAAHEGRIRIIGEQRGRRGVAPTETDYVDGRRDAPFETVKPDGIIAELFDYRAEVVKALLDELRARSPVGPEEGGHYRDEHFVMLDGRGLPPLTVPSPETLRNVRVITVANPMPYARKLEVRPGFAKQVDSHIYESAMRAVRADYGKIARFKFALISLSGAYKLHRDHPGKSRMASRSHRAGAEITYPSVMIEAL